ncbi:MAG: type II secretion system protein [Bacteroidales bacterium]
MNKNKGFTLIELLVVIAIIGILSSVVLASLTSARQKGKVAAIQSTMSSMRAQAEIGMLNGKYVADICNKTSAEGGIKTLLNSLGPASKATFVKCGENTGNFKWGVEATLPTTSATPAGTIFCVDSTGFSGTVGTTTTITAGNGSADVSCL